MRFPVGIVDASWRLHLPVALAATVLLRLGGILVGEAGLAEEFGDELLARQAIDSGLVVAAVELLRPGHCRRARHVSRLSRQRNVTV